MQRKWHGILPWLRVWKLGIGDMKIERKYEDFKPIIITLESEDDLNVLAQVMAYAKTNAPHGSIWRIAGETLYVKMKEAGL